MYNINFNPNILCKYNNAHEMNFLRSIELILDDYSNNNISQEMAVGILYEKYTLALSNEKRKLRKRRLLSEDNSQMENNMEYLSEKEILAYKKMIEEKKETENKLKKSKKQLRDIEEAIGLNITAGVVGEKNNPHKSLDKIKNILLKSGDIEDTSIIDKKKREEDKEYKKRYYADVDLFLKIYKRLVRDICINFEKIAYQETPEKVRVYRDKIKESEEYKIKNNIRMIVTTHQNQEEKVDLCYNLFRKYEMKNMYNNRIISKEFFEEIGGIVKNNSAKVVMMRRYLDIYLQVMDKVNIALERMASCENEKEEKEYIAFYIKYFDFSVSTSEEQVDKFASLTNNHTKTVYKIFLNTVNNAKRRFVDIFWTLINPNESEDEQVRKIFKSIIQIYENNENPTIRQLIENSKEYIKN